MYLFCVRVDLVLEQTARLIGEETKGSYLSTASRLRQPWCSCSLLSHPNNASRASQGGGGTWAALSTQKLVILQRDYVHPWDTILHWALQPEEWQDQVPSHPVSPSYLPPSAWFLNGKTYCLSCQFLVLSRPKSRSKAVHGNWMPKCNISLLIACFLCIVVIIFFFFFFFFFFP